MDTQQTKPRLRWYELEAFVAAFFAGLALGLLAILTVGILRGRNVFDRWEAWSALIFATVAGYWGQRFPRRILVFAMIGLWIIVFVVLALAA